MAILGTFTKQPAESWDYDIDYSQWLPPSDGLSQNATPEVTVSPDDGLKVESVTRDYDNKRLKVWLSGGVDGQRYKVETTMQSSEGRIRQDEFFVIVRDM